MTAAGGVPPNPLAIYEYPNSGSGGVIYAGYGSTANPATGKTPVSGGAAFVTGQKCIMSTGQSLEGDHNDTTQYTPTNTLVHQINPYDGLVYPLADPALGCSGGALGCFLPRVGNILRGTYSRIVMIPTAVGGSMMIDWSTKGQLNHRTIAGILSARKLGFPIDAIWFGLGPSDNNAGTSSATWQAQFNDWVQSVRGLGCNAPIFVAKQSRYVNVTSTTITGAQAAVVNNPAGIYAGDDCDSVTLSNNVDGTHMTAAGLALRATNVASILTAFPI